jgi:acetyltransferase-like isoleucine patch superfamily enzyme
MKGVSIGDNTVVAAGSLVTHSLPANVVAGGVPAKILKRIDGHQPGVKQ